MKFIFANALTKAHSAINSPKYEQLKICNASLMIVATLMLISSIQMETLSGDDLLGIPFTSLTFIYAGIGMLMFGIVSWHLYLHFGNFGWFAKLGKSPRLAKFMAIFGAVTLASGIFILAYMLTYFEHNLVGAIHGKIGFVFIALCAFISIYWTRITRKILMKNKF